MTSKMGGEQAEDVEYSVEKIEDKRIRNGKVCFLLVVFFFIMKVNMIFFRIAFQLMHIFIRLNII